MVGFRRAPFILVLVFAIGASGAGAETPVSNPGVITVEGEASADVAPDSANMVVTIEAERPTPGAASGDVARSGAAVLDALKAEGVDGPDVRTQAVTMVPVYSDDSARPHVPRAYRAATSLLVTIRPPDRAGVVVAKVIDKGATGIDDLTFASTDEAKTIDRLRADAMRDARRKAEIYVGALGLTLGRVLEIMPQEVGPRPPMVFAQAKSIMAAPPPVPVVSGSLHLRASVSVRFAIAD